MYDEEYYDDYDDYYDEEVINESALDMAMDMSDRYGIAIEDAYDFACDAMEGSLKDPHKRVLREVGRYKAAVAAHSEAKAHDRDFTRRFVKATKPGFDDFDRYEKAESYRHKHGDSGHASIDMQMKHDRLNHFRQGFVNPEYRGRTRLPGGAPNRGRPGSDMTNYSPEYYHNGRNSGSRQEELNRYKH